MSRHADPQLERRILDEACRLWNRGGEKALTMRAVHVRLGQDVRVAVDFSTGVAGPQQARTMRVVEIGRAHV